MGELAVEVKQSKFISIRRNDLLKLIAMITMFIDHLGHMGIVDMVIVHFQSKGYDISYDYYTLFRTIGRIAFPIFAYQVALGYSKTSNLGKYIRRLILFALVSHIPYIMFNRDFTIHPLHFNVIFMLLFGVFAIMCLEQSKKWFKKEGVVFKVLAVLMVVLMLTIIIFPQATDAYISTHEIESPVEPIFTVGDTEFNVVYDFAFSYGTYGILMVLMFHIFKGKPLRMIIAYVALEFFGFWLTYGNLVYVNAPQWIGESLSYLKSYKFDDKFQFLLDYKGGLYEKIDGKYTFFNGLFFQMRSLMALPFIIILERVYIRIKLNKFVGYWFYPLHILLIFLIALGLKQIL